MIWRNWISKLPRNSAHLCKFIAYTRGRKEVLQSPFRLQGHVWMGLQWNAKAWSQSHSPSLIPQEESSTQKITSMMFLPKVNTWNWKIGQQTHRGRIYSWGKIADMDSKCCPCTEEEWATSYLRGLLRSQQRLHKGWFPIAHHRTHDRFDHGTRSLFLYGLYCGIQSNPNGTERLRSHNISHSQRHLLL